MGLFFELFPLDIREGGVHGLLFGTVEGSAYVVGCDLSDGAGESQHTDQVGDHHQAVEGVGEVPRQPQAHRAAEVCHDDKDGFVDDGRFCAEEELKGFRAVMAPAEDGGVGEQ